MKRKILAFCGVFVALIVALVMPISAGTIGYNNIAVSYFPDGAFEVNTQKINFPAYFMTFRSSGIYLQYYDPTVTYSASVSGLDLVFEYRVSLPHPSSSPSTFDLDLYLVGNKSFWAQFPNISFSLTWRGSNVQFVHEDLEEDSYIHGSYPDGTSVDYHVPSSGGELPVLCSRLTASGLSYPSSNNQRLVLTVHNALYDMSFSAIQVQSIDDLFSVVDDLSLDPAMSVLDSFFDIPFIDYCMVGLGVVIVFSFIVRLF